MTPVTEIITIYRGDDWDRLGFDFEDDEGAPIEITDARLQVRRDPDDEETLLDLSVGAGLTLSGGGVDISITRAQSAELSGDMVWDLEITYGDDKVETIAAGKLIAVKDVTRA